MIPSSDINVWLKRLSEGVKLKEILSQIKWWAKMDAHRSRNTGFFVLFVDKKVILIVPTLLSSLIYNLW